MIQLFLQVYPWWHFGDRKEHFCHVYIQFCTIYSLQNSGIDWWLKKPFFNWDQWPVTFDQTFATDSRWAQPWHIFWERSPLRYSDKYINIFAFGDNLNLLAIQCHFIWNFRSIMFCLQKLEFSETNSGWCPTFSCILFKKIRLQNWSEHKSSQCHRRIIFVSYLNSCAIFLV